MKTRKTYQKAHNWVPKHNILKKQDRKSERNCAQDTKQYLAH